MLWATPIHGWLSPQHQSSASAPEYYITPPAQGPGMIVTFKKYYLRHTFCQAIKASDESETTSQQFWKDNNIYKAIKTLTLLGMKLQPLPWRDSKEQLYLKFVHDFWGFKKVLFHFSVFFFLPFCGLWEHFLEFHFSLICDILDCIILHIVYYFRYVCIDLQIFVCIVDYFYILVVVVNIICTQHSLLCCHFTSLNQV